MTLDEARDDMFEPNHFGMMMVKVGDADALISGGYSKYSETIELAKEIIGIREEYKHFGAMHILSTRKGTFFLARTSVLTRVLRAERPIPPAKP